MSWSIKAEVSLKVQQPQITMRKSLLLYKLTDKLHYPMDYSFKFSSLVIKSHQEKNVTKAFIWCVQYSFVITFDSAFNFKDIYVWLINIQNSRANSMAGYTTDNSLLN